MRVCTPTAKSLLKTVVLNGQYYPYALIQGCAYAHITLFAYAHITILTYPL